MQNSGRKRQLPIDGKTQGNTERSVKTGLDVGMHMHRGRSKGKVYLHSSGISQAEHSNACWNRQKHNATQPKPPTICFHIVVWICIHAGIVPEISHPQAIQDVDEFVSSSYLEKCSIASLAQ